MPCGHSRLACLGLTFARGGQLELALLDKLLHSPLAPRKAARDARCAQSII